MMPITGEKMLVRDDVHGVSERMVTLTPAVAHLLPIETCREHHVIPVEYGDGYLTVVSTSDANFAAADAIRAETGYEPNWVIADQAEIDEAIERLFASNGFTETETGAKFSAGDLVSHGLAIPPRLGEQLAGRGLVTLSLIHI